MRDHTESQTGKYGTKQPEEVYTSVKRQRNKISQRKRK